MKWGWWRFLTQAWSRRVTSAEELEVWPVEIVEERDGSDVFIVMEMFTWNMEMGQEEVWTETDATIVSTANMDMDILSAANVK